MDEDVKTGLAVGESGIALGDREMGFGLRRKHPNGVEPWGNYFCKKRLKVHSNGLGYFFALSDHILLDVFLPRLNDRELLELSHTSKAMYIFCSYDELWKRLTLKTYPHTWHYEGNWKMTFFKCKKYQKPANDLEQEIPSPPFSSDVRNGNKDTITAFQSLAVSAENLYSDYLYQSWECISTPINELEFACLNNIDRHSDLSLENFKKQYEIPNKPLILTNIVSSWNCWIEWTREKLLQRFSSPKQQFQVGELQMDLKRYFSYCDNVSNDEQPLYLFDNEFGSKYPDLLSDYQIPKYFEKDYFSILHEDVRPSYRWMFMGPPRSGSNFHKDPNSTSAWNALISGKKLWIFYPPDFTPPSIFPSKDGFKVTTPVSVMEWILRNFHETLKSGSRAFQCIQYPGDLVFVPNQWWHLVLNLEFSIGVTQNVVSDANLDNVCLFLQKKKDKTLWNEFQQEMKKKFPQKNLIDAQPKILWESNQFRFCSSE